MRRFVSLLLFVAACSGSDDSALDTLSADYAAAVCDWEMRCCPDELRPTPAECTAYSYWYDFEHEKEAVAAGTSTFQAEQAEECLRRITSGDCTPTLVYELERNGACSRLFVGEGGPGAACTDAIECAAGLVCTVGSCGGLPGLGDPCDGACAGDLWCRDSVCIQRLAIGETCADFWDCTSDNCVDNVCVESEPICLFADA